ncbi:hypothetical protein ACVBEH_07815 [Roseateles sp. GG27B]
MTPHSNGSPSGSTTEASIPELVAQVYAAAPPVERGHLLEQLLQPLGVLSLVAIADGIFAKVRFRSGWQDLVVRMEDIQSVRTDHVVALVDHAQQVSVEAVDGLAQWLTASPVLAGWRRRAADHPAVATCTAAEWQQSRPATRRGVWGLMTQPAMLNNSAPVGTEPASVQTLSAAHLLIHAEFGALNARAAPRLNQRCLGCKLATVGAHRRHRPSCNYR